MSALKSIIEANKAGQQAGIYSVCSAQPLVLRAALRHAARQRAPLLIELRPTRSISTAATPA